MGRCWAGPGAGARVGGHGAGGVLPRRLAGVGGASMGWGFPKEGRVLIFKCGDASPVCACVVGWGDFLSANEVRPGGEGELTVPRRVMDALRGWSALDLGFRWRDGCWKEAGP